VAAAAGSGNPTERSMSQLDSASTHASLLVAVRERDEQAWQRLTQIYGASVYRWCRRAGLQATDAADVVQEVFLAVANGIDQFHADRPGDTFRGWLWTIFRSKLIDHFRRRKVQPQGIGQQSGPSPVDVLCALDDSTISGAAGDEAGLIVRRAIATIEQDFSGPTWQAFWRSVVLGQRTSEIADSLQLTPAAVCMARSRVLRRLRETLDGAIVLPNS
jgi:RNA polymerase sigma-70 factor (ECF subfamily)